MKRVLTLLMLFLIVSWFSLEPDQVRAQSWGPTNGPFGGTTNCLTNNSTYVFASFGVGVFAHGVFRTSDGGLTWQSASNGLSTTSTGLYITAMVASDNYLIASSGTGVYRSSDNGDYWTDASFPGTYFPNAYLVWGDTIYAGGSSGLYISVDNGLNWIEKNSNFQGITAPNVAEIKSLARCGDYLYAGTYQKGIFRSSDRGETWVTVNSGLGTTLQLKSKNFANLIVNDNDIFAGTSTGQGVYRLLNNGTTWTQEVSGMPAGNPNPRNILSLTIRDGYIYAGGNAGLWRSACTGTMSWQVWNGNLSANQQFRCLLNTTSSVYAGIGSGKGIYKSVDNCNNWAPINNQILGSGIRRVVPGQENDLFAIADDGEVYHSADMGDNWLIQDYFAQGSGPNYHNGVIFRSHYGVSYRSVDNGQTWEETGWDVNHEEILFGLANFFFSDGNRLFAGSTAFQCLYYSDDNGSTWIPANGIVNNDPNASTYPVVISLSRNDDYMFAGTLYCGLYRSSDSGITWTACYPTIGQVAVNAVATKNNYVFIATEEGIRRSSDNGVSWTTMNNGLFNLSIRDMVFYDTVLYVGTASGVFKSDDYGATWNAANLGFTTLPYASSLAIRGNYLFTNFYLYGSPVYKRELTGTVPAIPEPISGTQSPCIGSQEVYSVNNVSGVNYNWQFPAGWTIVSGGTTNSVTVTVGSAPGIILVTPYNGWGSGPFQFLLVSPTTCALDKTLTLTSVYLEGLYSGAGHMTQANDENGPHFGSGIADEVTIELHNGTDYSTVEYSATANLTTTGTITLSVPSVHSGSYYVTIRHRNSVETTTAATLSFSGSTVSYAFNAANKAYGDNLVLMAGGDYAIYSGDVNQDGYVDIGDQSEVETQANNFISGYEVPDLNGDGYIDISDQAIAETNASSFTGAILP